MQCFYNKKTFFLTDRKMGGLESKNVQEGLGKGREG